MATDNRIIAATLTAGLVARVSGQAVSETEATALVRSYREILKALDEEDAAADIAAPFGFSRD